MIEYNINFIFAVYSFFIFAALFVFLRLPAVNGYQNGSHKINFWQILTNFSLLRIYFYVLVLGTSFGFFNTFHVLYSVERGITSHWLGVGIMVGSLSQFPAMLYFDRLYERFGIRRR